VLAYADEGAGPPLVLLHGIGSDRTRWAPIVAHLRDDHRCVAVDLPGFGGSPAEGCDATDAARAVHELVGHLGLDGATVVGHSLGSTIALLYGVLFPPTSVVAVDPAPLHLPDLAERLAPFRDRLLGDDFDAAFVEWERTTLDTGPLGPDAVLPSTSHPSADVVRSYWTAVLDLDRAAEVATGWSAALATLPSPALLLLAAEPSPEDARILAPMTTATVEVWDGQGHWLHLVDPERFARRVRDWVAAHPA
jgi:pimeloyl-ACP methyl ester carboxylesterase